MRHTLSSAIYSRQTPRDCPSIMDTQSTNGV